MRANFGEHFKLTIFGESHGPAIGVVLSGVPAGLPLDLDAVREELLRRMWSLASARANDAVKLAFLPEEQMGAIGKLDLAALTELKRVSSGTVELKFTDRMRALETLYKLLEQEREGGRLEAFYEDLDGGGDK